MTGPAIVFDHVSKSYPLYHHITGGIKHLLFNLPKSLKLFRSARFEALTDISFQVRQGESLGIVGRNGAGKSTMLGLMAGVLRPSSGTVVMNGRISPLLELGGGFHPELTGCENIMLNGVLLGMTRDEVRERMEAITAFSELGEFINQPIRTFSSGMLARLGFSVIAYLDSEILLIDEILAVGDQNFQKKCIDKMIEFRKNGVTMVLVSHSMEDIKRVCDRAIWVENHRMKMVGAAAEVVAAYMSAQ